jgi:hypothetical protein
MSLLYLGPRLSGRDIYVVRVGEDVATLTPRSVTNRPAFWKVSTALYLR